MYFLIVGIEIGPIRMLQIFILAVVAIFLFWRLKAVLGSRDGFEKTLRDIKEPNAVIGDPGIIDQPDKDAQDDDTYSNASCIPPCLGIASRSSESWCMSIFHHLIWIIY